MLNEDKIKLMTELALFEKKHASQMKTVNQYFKSDYISRNLLRGFISYTLCSILLFGMWVLFNVEVVLSSIGMDELKGLAFVRSFIPRGAFSVCRPDDHRVWRAV